MDFKNIPRNYTLGFILLTVIVLTVALVLEPASLLYRDKTNYEALRKQAELENQQYAELLASANPNYEASQQFLEKIATEDLVRQQVTQTLQTGQKITIPTVASTDLNISNRTDRDTMVNYFTQSTSMVGNYQNDVSGAMQQLFADGSDYNSLRTAENRTNQLVQNLRGMAVPKDAVEMHKANIVAYQQYAQVFSAAANYAATSSEPWSNFYKNYAVINNRIGVSKTELDKISKTYALDTEPSRFGRGGFLIKEAQAQLGVVTVAADLERAIIEGIKTGLARAFAQFAISMIDKLVAHIEKNFAIASQLYYSNDLGRFYSVEYMKKFVQDPLDQDIIQKFLPQYFCVNPTGGELKKIFTAKAAQNRATDLVIDPSEPDFLQKLARLGGDEKNYPQWWESYYENIAAQTQAEAEKAATKEVLSPGLKSGRDLINGQINKTMSAIFNVQESAIAGVINLGTNNTENVVASLVASVVQNLVNKFVFTPLGGTNGGGGGIGVIKETNVCLKNPVIKPVAPVANTDYQTPNTNTNTNTNTGTTTPPFNPR